MWRLCNFLLVLLLLLLLLCNAPRVNLDKSDLFVDERVVVEELFVNAFEEIAVGREEIFGARTESVTAATSPSPVAAVVGRSSFDESAVSYCSCSPPFDSLANTLSRRRSRSCL